MFDQSLVNKAVADSQWRRNTALGRKVASKISVEDCYNLYRKDLKYQLDEEYIDACEEHFRH